MLWSKKNSRYNAREWESKITKQDKRRPVALAMDQDEPRFLERP